jgi:hypothetical protein
VVEHHLAKVRVAGSNPVIRSEELTLGDPGGVAERRGKGLQIPVHGFKSRLHLVSAQRVSEVKKLNIRSTTVDWRSWLARFLDMEEVTGSSPVSTTITTN